MANTAAHGEFATMEHRPPFFREEPNLFEEHPLQVTLGELAYSYSTRPIHIQTYSPVAGGVLAGPLFSLSWSRMETTAGIVGSLRWPLLNPL